MSAQASTREHVKLLCKSIVTKLENRKSIAFPPRLRQIVQEEVYGLIGPYILTEQDIRERAITKMGARAEMLEDSTFTEGEQFRTAKSVIKGQLGDDVLNGFYFQKPLKTLAGTVVSYLMRSASIDEVYETDEDLEKQIVEMVQKFNPDHVH